MSGTLSSVYSFFYPSSISRLGYLSLDVLTTETLKLPMDVTKYPIEDGSGEVTDHITVHNEELSIHGKVSAATSFGAEFGSQCYSKLIDAVSQLRKMHTERKEVTILTGLGKYDHMAFTELSIERSASDPGGQWLTISASLRKIKKVAVKKADLPADTNVDTKTSGKTGNTEQRGNNSNTGNQNVTPGASPALRAAESARNSGNATVSRLGSSAIGPLAPK